MTNSSRQTANILNRHRQKDPKILLATKKPVNTHKHDPEYKGEYEQELNSGLGISSVAATCMNFLGFEAPEDYDKSLIRFK